MDRMAPGNDRKAQRINKKGKPAEKPLPFTGPVRAGVSFVLRIAAVSTAAVTNEPILFFIKTSCRFLMHEESSEFLFVLSQYLQLRNREI